MTTADVGTRLGVSAQFIRGEILDGRLKANVTKRKVRHVYRITEEQFAEYEATHWRAFQGQRRAS